MKKFIISLAVLAFAGSMMAQDDKAALKEAQKKAKAEVAAAQKIKDDVYAKMNNKEPDQKVNPADQINDSRKGLKLVTQALKSGVIDEKKLGETYKLAADLAVVSHNIMLGQAVAKEAMDTAFFYDNLKMMTDNMYNEIKNTKIIKGEGSNEGYIKTQKLKLAQCGDYYIYAAQFEGQCKRYDRSLESYETAMNYKSKYPEVADMVNMRIDAPQIAYYAYHTAHDAKMYDKMDKFYDQAIQFEEGALGVKQVKMQSYLERGDSATWANYVREMTLEDPEKYGDYVQILLAYYMKKGGTQMSDYADAVLAKDPESLMANYGKAFSLFSAEKYEDAMTYYKKCTEIKPDYYDAWYQCGLCKYKPALAKNASISSIKNQTQAKAELENVKKMLTDALPFFEKARECTPDQPMKWAFELKTCYSVTGNAAKAAEMDKLL